MEKKTKVQTLFVGAVIGVIAILGIVSPQDTADVVWGVFKIPALALFIDESGDRAGEIGEYYFNAKGSGVYNTEKAEKYYRKALEYDPEHRFARHQLARIQFLRGDFTEALQTINDQIARHGDEVVASYYVRGLIYGFQGDTESAEEDFLHFIEAKPRNWGGYNDLAWIYFQQGEYERARVYAERGLALAESNPWLLTTYGVSLFNLGDTKGAQNALEEALELAQGMTPSDWLNTNPGNNPSIAESGVEQMIRVIEQNLELIVDN